MDDPINKLAFKGMELYSWQDESSEWVFSILYGTNRLKTIPEVKSGPMDTAAVNECLCLLPDGESVFWLNAAQIDAAGKIQPLSYPPENIIRDIQASADRCGVKLSTPILGR